MKLTTVIWVSAMVLFLTETYDAKKYNKKCKKTSVTCPCGRHGQNVTVPLQMCTVKDPVTGAKNCELCNKNLMEGDICSRFDNCETCVKGHTVCATCPPGGSGDYCIMKKSEDQGMISYPIVARVPAGVPISGTRFIRRAKTCKYPPVMNTAEIECKIWPKNIVCKEYCLFGFTFPNSTSRELSCIFDEDKWTPRDFEECKPFIDCSTALVSGGTLNCTSNQLTRGNRCDIECLGVKGKTATAKKTYECDINGKWTPKLPFCAKQGTGLKLVQRPLKYKPKKI